MDAARQLWAFSLYRFLFGTSRSTLNYSLIVYDIVVHAVLCLRRGDASRRCAAAGQVDAQSSSAHGLLPSQQAASICERTLISVVIPAYNEGADVCAAIAAALDDPRVEVIVADGGSRDGTPIAAKRAGAVVVEAPSGRAACQNAGAAAARGDVLLFLHGDTILPAGYGARVREALRRDDCGVVAFTLALHPRLPGIGLVEWGANRRSRTLGLPYGDQALAMRREVFDALGGFPQQPLLEDLDLVLAARRRGRVITLPEQVLSSARRWELHGVVGNTLCNQLVLLGHRLDVPLDRIAAWYYGASGRKHY